MGGDISALSSLKATAESCVPSVEVSGTVVVVCGRQAFGSDILGDCYPESIELEPRGSSSAAAAANFPSRRSQRTAIDFGETDDDGEREDSETAQG